MMNPPKTKIATFGSLLALFVAGLLLGVTANRISGRVCEGQHKLINSAMVCGQTVAIEKHGYASTQELLAEYINQKTNEEVLTDAAVYFRDLENGPAWGINEIADFAPASLLKVPFSFVYLNMAVNDPSILDKTLAFGESDLDIPQTIDPELTIVPNQKYTIEELLRRMITYSDNNAYALLQDYLDLSNQRELIPNTYLELGIIAPQDIYDDVISVRRYASIFRALYNSSYLNPDLSEKVLLWLSESNYRSALVAGVPGGVPVAHKFGERYVDNDTRQLHDCGIVYFPENPYLLCVMTVGRDYKELEKVISTVSKMVYEEVDSRKLDE